MTPFEEVTDTIQEAILKAMAKETTIVETGHALNAADAVMSKVLDHARELEKQHPEWEPAYTALAEHFGYDHEAPF